MGATGSGAERVLVSHVNALAKRGHTITVVSGGRGASSVAGNVEVRRVGWSTATPWRARAEADRCARAGAIDALLVYHALPAQRLLRARALLSVPWLQVFLSPWPEEYTVREIGARRIRHRVAARLRHALERRALARATRVVPTSRFMADRVRARYRVPDEKIRVVPNGVDLDRFAPRDRARVRHALALPPDAPIILTLRNLEPRMGIDALIDAMRAVRRAHPDAVLIVAGAGPLRETLEARAEAHRLADAVRFAGFIAEERVADLYAAADLFVLPSQALEGFGLVTLEALACGTPVIGTPVGATPELLAPLDPTLVLPDASAEAIGQGILAFLARGDRKDLGVRGRAWAARYTWDAVVAQIEHVIAEARR